MEQNRVRREQPLIRILARRILQFLRDGAPAALKFESCWPGQSIKILCEVLCQAFISILKGTCHLRRGLTGKTLVSQISTER